MVELGNFRIFCLNDGFFKLDGGAMFGIIPKIIWQTKNPPDEQNRILLSLNCVFIQNKKTGENILIDTGIGWKTSKEEKRFKKFYDFSRSLLLENLRKCRVLHQEINFVINTHLHLDHSGGNTYFDGNKNLFLPTFENAKYVIQEGELSAALSGNERTKASYLRESFHIFLNERGHQLLLVKEAELEILPGIKLVRTGGHTKYHQGVKIESEGKIAFYLGDLIPTVSHLEPAWIMGYDLEPLITLRQKENLLAEAFSKNWLLIFEHDPKIAMGFLKKDETKWAIDPLEYLEGAAK